MLANPPPDTCDHCRSRSGSWRLVEGAEQELTLDDGRAVVRRGRVYICGICGHTVPVSTEGLHHSAWEASKKR